MASKVESLKAFALPYFNMNRFAVVIPLISAKSLLFILRFASITSKFTSIGIVIVLVRFLVGFLCLHLELLNR